MSPGSVFSSPERSKSVLESKSNDKKPSLSSSQIIMSATGKTIGRGLTINLNDVLASKHPVVLFSTLTKISVEFTT